MLFGRPTVRDARGRRVSLIRHEVVIPGMVNDERYTRLERAADADSLTRAEKKRFALYTVASLPLFLAVSVLPPMLLDINRWWTFLYFVPGVFFPACVTIWIARRATGQRIARTYARAGLCASCGYELGAIPADADGARTCPECGSAWTASSAP